MTEKPATDEQIVSWDMDARGEQDGEYVGSVVLSLIARIRQEQALARELAEALNRLRNIPEVASTGKELEAGFTAMEMADAALAKARGAGLIP